VSFTTNKPRFIFSGFFTILFSLFLVSAGFTANKNRINRSTLQNDQQSNQSQMKDTRSIMPGLIIVKFKENMSGASSAALRNIPSIEAKTAKYQGYTLDQAFPFLQNSRAVEPV